MVYIYIGFHPYISSIYIIVSYCPKTYFDEYLVMYFDGEILSPRFKITASARSFDVTLEGRSTGTGGSFDYDTSTRMDQKI